jgi:hypothetical protein
VKHKKKTAINVFSGHGELFLSCSLSKHRRPFAGFGHFLHDRQADTHTHTHTLSLSLPLRITFFPRLIDLNLQPLLAVCYRLLPLGKSGVLAGHAAAESALELGSEGEFADLLALVAAHDIALLLEAGVLHALEARAPRFDVCGFGVLGERAAAAGRGLLGVHGGVVITAAAAGGGGFVVVGRRAGGGVVGGSKRGLEAGRAGVGAEAGGGLLGLLLVGLREVVVLVGEGFL